MFPDPDPEYDLVIAEAYQTFQAARLSADYLAQAGITAYIPERVYGVAISELGTLTPLKVLRQDVARARALLAEFALTLNDGVSDDDLTAQALAEAPPEDAVD